MREPETDDAHRGSASSDGDGDADANKGVVEGDRPGDRTQQGNAGAPALDAEGRPSDWQKICEDVIGANDDGSQG
jgi:hypothetical protein